MTSVLQAAERDKFTSMGRQMGHWVDHVLGRGFQHFCHSDTWSPAINLCEYDSYYCVIVELAGVQAAGIDLQAERGRIVLTGERAMPAEPKARGEMRIHLMEIDHGRFRREVELPEGVDVDGIEAFYRGGYLWIRIPKNTRG